MLFLKASPLEVGLEKSTMGRTSRHDSWEAHELQFPRTFTQSVAEVNPYLHLEIIFFTMNYGVLGFRKVNSNTWYLLSVYYVPECVLHFT